MIRPLTRMERAAGRRLAGVVLALLASTGVAPLAFAQPAPPPPLRAQTPRMVFPLARGRTQPPSATLSQPPLAANEVRVADMCHQHHNQGKNSSNRTFCATSRHRSCL